MCALSLMELSFQDSKGWHGVGTGLNASNASTLSEEAQETTALELWGDCPALAVSAPARWSGCLHSWQIVSPFFVTTRKVVRVVRVVQVAVASWLL